MLLVCCSLVIYSAEIFTILVLFLRSVATNEVLLMINAMLVLFLRSVATDEVLLMINAMLVLFLRSVATNEMLLMSNTSRECTNIVIFRLSETWVPITVELCVIYKAPRPRIIEAFVS